MARAYAEDVRGAGGEIRTGVPSRAWIRTGVTRRSELVDGSRIEGDEVIVCAGLQADRLAMASGEPAEPRIVPFRGEYWQLRPERTHLVRGLIYPVPDPALPFLGVHLTRKIDGTVVLGPNAILSTARHAYERRRFVAARHLRGDQLARDACGCSAGTGVSASGRSIRSASKRQFVREVARYVPAVDRGGRAAGVGRRDGRRRSTATDRSSTTSAWAGTAA